MPIAARVTDLHMCPKFEGPAPHGGGTIKPEGDPTVEIGFKPAARQSDGTAHGGVIMGGFPTVHIGDSPQGASFMGSGAPLVKPCELPGAPLMV